MATITFKNHKNGSVMSFDNERLVKIDGKTIGSYQKINKDLIIKIGSSGFVLKPDQIKSQKLKMVFGKENQIKVLKYCGPVGVVCAIGTYMPTKFNKELRERFFNGTNV